LVDEEKLWAGFDKKLRNAIRKSEKFNLEADNGIKYFDDFYKIFQTNMRDLGTPVDSKKFFNNLIKNNKDKVDIFVTKKDGEVISAIFLIKNQNILKSEWASSYRKYFGMNSAQFTYWECIKHYCKEFEYFDFGRSMKGEGTYNFKKKFSPEIICLHYIYHLNKGDMPNLRKDNLKRRIFSSIWKKLPLLITNRLGPIIRRNFP
ncbi:GNAT family N-acetyltransferase, partial [Candidatus Woesearchaeota archaeon]|nr:GNAT family N-acetyltransferase [Candidatus Woesearchaeota archaeon]